MKIPLVWIDLKNRNLVKNELILKVLDDIERQFTLHLNMIDIHFEETNFLMPTNILVTFEDSIFVTKTTMFLFYYYVILKNHVKKIYFPENTSTIHFYFKVLKKAINTTKSQDSAFYFKIYIIAEPECEYISKEEFEKEIETFKEIVLRDKARFEEIIKFFGKK